MYWNFKSGQIVLEMSWILFYVLEMSWKVYAFLPQVLPRLLFAQLIAHAFSICLTMYKLL
jgi:hypothetical protein